MLDFKKIKARNSTPFIFLLFLCVFVLWPANASSQQKNKKENANSTPAAQPALTRTTTSHETRRFAYGGTLSIIGAPAGSITIEAWPRNEVDITADIELHADTEEDLTRLASVNGFLLDEDANHLRLVTRGTHDKLFMRRNFKDFPKRLLGLPWKVDYRIHIPVMTDVEIDAGRGPINLSGFEGAIKLTALESDATLTLTGGTVLATIGSGSVNVNIATRSWRGAGADIRLATGDLTVQLPAGFNADIDAEILRSGQIENTFAALTPRERNSITPRSLKARAGAGGATLSFTVGDGTLRIKQQ